MKAQSNMIQEISNKDQEELKDKQKEISNAVTEMQNTLEGINSRITETEKQKSELKDRMVEIMAMNKEKRMKRNKDTLRDLWDSIKHTSICIRGIPEGEERSDNSCNFPGVSDGKVSAHNVGDLDSIPESGRFPGEGNGNTFQYPSLESPMGGGDW